ncbi:AraC-like transcriptional regulator QhpR [Caenispirillum salinarum]|uniref:AraC-like transcriptional regulator QhpR n=1 Tax=Caenispirillum salinarum TaxID=859058 RepID=UPI00068D871F|nr:AraC family transcriptional regulator [Caenispirillum salinarum]
METAKISARPLAVLDRRLGLPGAERTRFLSRHHLDDGSLNGGDDAAIPLRDFVEAMEDLGAVTGDSILGWAFGESYDLQELGEFGLALSLAPTLGTALRTFERAFCTIQTGTRVRLEVEGDEATFHYTILDQDIWPRRQDAELTLGLLSGLVRRFCGPDWRPAALGFEHGAGPGSIALSDRLRRGVRYNQDSNSLTLSAGLLDRRRPEASDAGFIQISRMLDRRVRETERALRLRTRVKLAVLEGLHGGEVDQTAVAGALGMSRRTLRRRLEEEGITFQRLVDECRHSSAVAWLTRTDLSLSEIALRLGYSDQTAFSRAFTRWAGASPRAVRKSARGLTT